MGEPQANKDLVMRFVRANNDGDMDALDELLARDFKRHCPATPGVEVNCPDDFKAFLQRTLIETPDAHVEAHHVVAEGDMVALWSTFSGTQEGQMGPFPPTGKKFTADFGAFFRIEGERIAELWVTWDNLDGLAQLGHIDLSSSPGAG
ncbi:MAG: ester cyclase [Acidobacteriota bacterium]|jgi:steroid delta-isomerase-like uncharacterized protein